ncbi:hypothetical protein C2G38_2036939 [Gigaspora rosea]|uniref:CCHC-type domain-containing protein n=1 Tax=Gigaspora rosea TaxID=44941 RepID=A0A397VGB5_9GLOM|nr:hypothetical protein C2G38_2036939 [Gigaspora rosea]
MLIPRRWYKTKKQLEEMSILCQQPFTDSIQESSEETVYTETYIELPYKVADISYKRIHKSLNQCKEYVMANGLFKKAIQMGLDAGPFAIQEMHNIMENYIVRYTPKHNQEVTRRNPRTLLDNSHNVENYSDIANDTNSNSIDDDYGSYSEENEENIDPSLIQNPIIRSKKGALRKSQFKGSQETNLKNKEQPKAAGRKPTECQQCHKFGHNKAGCEKWHKKIKFHILLSD